nr:retrovirus-related Pol polyprotein from transposon TNT 1-94 [Tanacetum cinerariifolium]
NGVAERKNKTLMEAARTMDYLGKFDEKADEGFFCTILCVVAGKQTNGIAETKDNIVTGLLQQERQAEYINSTNSFNNVSSPVNTARPSFVNAALPSPINAARTPTSTNAFEEHPFERNAYNDEAVEEEVDINIVDSSYTIPDAPFTKFLKDHPRDQKPVLALKDPSWVEAMQDELLQFKLLNVWTLVYLPKDKWEIGTKWVFRNKKDERGIVIKNKARLVAQGYTQEEGIDNDKDFAPVARIESIRLFLAYTSFKDFVAYQIDVKSDFLYGKIEDEVYFYQPPGFEDLDFLEKVYKVEKAIYGLHQA